MNCLVKEKLKEPPFSPSLGKWPLYDDEVGSHDFVKLSDLLKMNWDQFGRGWLVGGSKLGQSRRASSELKLDPDLFPKLRSDRLIYNPPVYVKQGKITWIY